LGILAPDCHPSPHLSFLGGDVARTLRRSRVERAKRSKPVTARHRRLQVMKRRRGEVARAQTSLRLPLRGRSFGHRRSSKESPDAPRPGEAVHARFICTSLWSTCRSRSKGGTTHPIVARANSR
jgi:hypothetical protein